MQKTFWVQPRACFSRLVLPPLFQLQGGGWPAVASHRQVPGDVRRHWSGRLGIGDSGLRGGAADNLTLSSGQTFRSACGELEAFVSHDTFTAKAPTLY